MFHAYVPESRSSSTTTIIMTPSPSNTSIDNSSDNSKETDSVNEYSPIESSGDEIILHYAESIEQEEKIEKVLYNRYMQKYYRDKECKEEKELNSYIKSLSPKNKGNK